MESETHQLLQEQIEYYRARAPEFDQLYRREGQYDLGEKSNEQWYAELEAVKRAITESVVPGNTLELACGTGVWTQFILEHAVDLTAVDSSPEMIELHRQRLDSRSVKYVRADLFDWRPTERYDFVFFAFWLSHVPEEKFEPFWEMVSSALMPGGKFFFVDNLVSSQQTSKGSQSAQGSESAMTRRLNDGREFRIVKLYHKPATLQQRLEEMGWDARIESTDNYFVYGSGSLNSRR